MANANPMEVEKSLKGIDFPAKKRDLVKHAKQRGADQKSLKLSRICPKKISLQLTAQKAPSF